MEDNNYYRRCIIKRNSLCVQHHLKLPLESLSWTNARDVGSRQLWRTAFTTYYAALLILVSFISLYTLCALANHASLRYQNICVYIDSSIHVRLIQLPKCFYWSKLICLTCDINSLYFTRYSEIAITR